MNVDALSYKRQFSERNWASFSTSASTRSAIGSLFEESAKFFECPQKTKSENAIPNSPSGYRKVGDEYSYDPDRPDLFESFSVRWCDRQYMKSLTSEGERLKNAASTLYKEFLTEVEDLISGLQALYTIDRPGFAIDDNSIIQINHYPPPLQNREIAVDRHEDGSLLTLLVSDKGGLEIESPSGEWQPCPFGDNEVVVLPALILTALTGHDIAPGYHRVRGIQPGEARTSIVFFANPNIDRSIENWVINEKNRDQDVVEMVKKVPLRFGLKELDG